MSEYVLPHELKGEQQRLRLMAALLDPMERRHLEDVGLRQGWRCLEVGCGIGSISQWLAEKVGPSGHVVASDIDVTYLGGLPASCLKIRRLDILRDEIEVNAYDLVVCRAVLHHLADAQMAVQHMITALKPGGILLSIEPDMLPCTVAEPEVMRGFWQGWLKWSEKAGIDYFIGRKISQWLDAAGLEDVGGAGHTALFNGTSDWARYWTMSIRELAPTLLKSGHVTERMLDQFFVLYQEPHYWTSVITFTASWGRKPV